MNWMNAIGNILQNYSQPAQPSVDHNTVADHFGQVAQAAPPAALAEGLSAMFRSDQTPPFPQMVSQLFSNSNPNQRASLLNTLLSSGAGAAILSQLTRSTGINLPVAQNNPPITPEAAAQIPPQAVQQAAERAEQHDPSIVDRVSEIYAQHPMLVRTLGAAAMGLALSHLANRRR